MDAYQRYKQSGADIADEVMQTLNACLTDDPNDVDALSVAGIINYDAGRFGMAEVLLTQALRLRPTHSSAWQELGRARHARNESEAAAKCFSAAVRITGDRCAAYHNLMLMNNTLGRPEKALEMAPVARFLCETDTDRATLNGDVAIACLMLRKWAAGWANYDGLLNDALRKELFYEIDGQVLPRWDGTPFGPTTGDYPPPGEVIVYGEQGLGDEIMFASMIPDLQKDCRVIIHCDRRLEGLFKRSFAGPDQSQRCTAVYSGRGKKTGTEWIKNHRPKAAIAMGSLGQFYRRNEADFPRAPYLVADPEKRAMCRALLSQWPGRKIGLAWSGGSKKTRAFDRSLTLEQLEPLLSMAGVTWVSLEYAGDDPKEPRIKHLPFLTRSQDYDDTAALVAELDAVITVTTTVAHLAGSLGVECHVLVPEAPTWHWGKFGESAWHPTKSYRRTSKDWTLPVLQIKTALEIGAI